MQTGKQRQRCWTEIRVRNVVPEISVEETGGDHQEVAGCVVLSSGGRKPKRKVRLAESDGSQGKRELHTGA